LEEKTSNISYTRRNQALHYRCEINVANREPSLREREKINNECPGLPEILTRYSHTVSE